MTGPSRRVVRIVAPTGAGARITALRWAVRLRQLGVRVALDVGMPRGSADLLVALLEDQTLPAVRAFRTLCPDAPVVVALTPHHDRLEPFEALEVATRLLALQPRVADVLPPGLRARLRIIFPSACPRSTATADDQPAIVWRADGAEEAVCDAIAAGAPILSTRIPATVGILGEGYPGYFPEGDEVGRDALRTRVQEDRAFRSELLTWGDRLRPLVTPAREREAWADLLAELGLPVKTPASTRLSIVATPIASERAALSRDVAEGLSRRPRELSCQFLYDLEGSALFEQICRTPEYYLTRTERAILTERAPALAAAMPPGALLYELGCGNAEKTRIVLDALCRRQSRTVFVPVDISRDMLVQTARALLVEQPALEIRAIAGEYEAGLGELARPVGGVPPARLVLWLGSNIGNFSRPAAVTFLGHVRQALSTNDRLLVGIDLRKSKEVLEPAYDDAQGVTARFSKNLLARINRELDANFVLDAWAHRARYDEREGRVVIGLVSRKAQVVRVRALDLEVAFAEGEVIHTEDSHKYSFEEIGALARGAGLRVAERWTDEEVRFAVVVFAPA